MSALTSRLESSFSTVTAKRRAHRSSIDLGQRAPFRRSPDSDVELAATLDGELPSWLAGDLVRTCPAVFQTGKWHAEHWFDALGMLFRFRLSGGSGSGSVTYRQRLMASDTSREIESGRARRGFFATPRQGFLERLRSPLPEPTDNPNVNVVALGEQRVALTESPVQWALDPESLVLTHKVRYTDAEGSLSMIAHPHFDFERGRVVNLGVRFGSKTQIVIYDHAPEARERRVVGHVDVRRLPYVHSFGLTPRHAIVIGHPFDVNPLRLVGSRRGFIDHFAWRPEQGTRLWLIDRETGRVRTHTAPPGFVFHVVNAFEDGERTCIDVALYPDATIIDRLRASALSKQGLPVVAPPIVRWSMRPGAEAAGSEVLSSSGFEFPSVNYRVYNGQRYKVAFGARIGAADGLPSSTLVRTDLEAGERRFERADFVFGEPLYVARPGASAETDGVVLTVGSHVSEARSALVVLDAESFEQRAWAELPLPIPLGFHGSFFRA